MHLADVADGHHLVAVGLDRQAQNVLGRGHHARQLHREIALPGDQVPGRNQLVVAPDDVGEIGGADVVGLHPGRIDGDLQHLVAAAGNLGAQDARQGFQVILQGLGRRIERPFGRRPGQDDAQDRVVANVLLLDDRRQGVRWEQAARQVDLGPHVLQHLVLVEIDLELERHQGQAFVGPGVHLLQALDRFQLALERSDEQALGVLRADAGVGHLHHDIGHGDVRLRFARQGQIRPQPEGAQHQGHRQYDLAPLDGAGDQGLDHGLAPGVGARATRTVWPSET